MYHRGNTHSVRTKKGLFQPGKTLQKTWVCWTWSHSQRGPQSVQISKWKGQRRAALVDDQPYKKEKKREMKPFAFYSIHNILQVRILYWRQKSHQPMNPLWFSAYAQIFLVVSPLLHLNFRLQKRHSYEEKNKKCPQNQAWYTWPLNNLLWTGGASSQLEEMAIMWQMIAAIIEIRSKSQHLI